MLDIIDIAKTLPGGRSLFAGLSLSLAAGEYVAIMGESGVGKSTLLNLIAGLEPLDAGEIRIDGQRISGLADEPASRLRREKLGFVFQAFHVLPHLTLEQNVRVALLLPGRDDPRRAADMLAAVGLGERRHAYPSELSGGELQRVAIARALVHRPTLLLADEPTGNLDRATADVVFDLLLAQCRERGTSLVLVTHDMALARRASRVVQLTDGVLAALAPSPFAN